MEIASSLRDIIQKAGNEFIAQKNAGNLGAAKRKAAEISRLYKNLAEMDPERKKDHLGRSEHWGEISRNLKPEAAGGSSQNNAVSKMAGSETEDAQLRSRVDALITKSSIRWGDIGGLDVLKHDLMDNVVVSALQKPEAIHPEKGILLFGPPGTGKTLIASAIAGNLDATFYNVKAGSILSKYFGESSQLISHLYDSAREHSPSIVFVDEFDSLVQSRDNESSEASRTVLSTLLLELDGLADKKSDRFILTLAATNRPWDFDSAILSRFPMRRYVSLPDAISCESIIKLQMAGLDISNVNLKRIAETSSSNFYSGRDLEAFCHAACMNMIHDVNPRLYKLAELPYEELKKMKLNIRPLTDADFDRAWKKIRSPMTKDTIEHYEQWAQENGGYPDEDKTPS